MPASDLPPAPDEPLEEALAQALDLLDTDGEPALERFLADHPDQAPRLREALAELQHAALLHTPRDITAMPQQLGDFRIGRQLGAGGMGIVYAAEQVSLGRQVALKVVRPELLFFEGARERFRREIDAVARLEHPALVPILATGTTDGVPYYAMPLLRGRSAEAVVKLLAAHATAPRTGADLRAALDAGPEAGATDADGTFQGAFWHAAVRLVRKAALGIQHAHARGVLHRDLKPSNVMLGADGRAIVLDFGLALARGDARLTRTGTHAGSPAYMAPEQVRGEPIDERTDVYGLGALLHCLLGQRPPFALDEPEVLRSRILAGQRQVLRDPALPPELHLVLDTALEVERQRRYASAEAFAEDLQAVLDGRAIRARALPFPVRIRRFAQRHRALATAAAALGVFALVLPSALLYQQQRANRELAQQVERADRSVAVSIDTVERLLAGLARDRLRNLPQVQEVAAQMLREADEQFARLGEDPRLGARVADLRRRALMRLTEVEAALGDPRAATAAARQALVALASAPPSPAASLQRAIVRRQLATSLLEQGAADEATQLVAAARQDLDAAGNDAPQATAVARELGLSHGIEATLAMARGDAAATERAQRAAVEATRRGATDPQGWLAHGIAQVNLARLLKQTKRLDEALQCTTAAEDSAEAAGSEEFGWPVPRFVRALAANERARIHQEQGSIDTSIADHQVALAQLEDLLRDYPDEPSTRRLHGAAAHNLANLLAKLERYAEARPLAEAAIRDQLQVLQRNPTDAEALRFLGNHRRTLGNTLWKLGDFAALEPVARDLGAMAGGPEAPGTAARHLLRCAAHVAGTDAAKAGSLQQEALELLVETKRRGVAPTAEDPLYAPLRDEPRFQALLDTATGK